MSQIITKKISVIIPLYNEAESLEELNSKILKVLLTLPLNHEIIYINDGSTDQSFEVLKKLYQQNEKIKVIQFKKNFGKSAALACGFDEADGDLIITLDADLQDDPEEIPNLISKINEGYDLVSGWKKGRNDNFIKLISSKFFNLTVSALSGIKLHDFNCGFKIYRNEVIKNIEVYGELHRFLPVLAHQKGFKIGELAVAHSPRKFGKSKYGKFGLRRLNNYFLDIMNVILITKYAKKPVHFFGSFGILASFVGFIFCLYLTILWLLGQRPISNRPLLFLGILLIIVGVQLISLGFLGEMIIRSTHKKEDQYYISQKLER